MNVTNFFLGIVCRLPQKQVQIMNTQIMMIHSVIQKNKCSPVIDHLYWKMSISTSAVDTEHDLMGMNQIMNLKHTH